MAWKTVKQQRSCPVAEAPQQRMSLAQAWVFLSCLGVLLGLASAVLLLEGTLSFVLRAAYVGATSSFA
jgi:hypothetical protein